MTGISGKSSGPFSSDSSWIKVVFHYRMDDGEWRQVPNRQFPWEFSTSGWNGEKQVEFYISTQTTEGGERSERLILHR